MTTTPPSVSTAAYSTPHKTSTPYDEAWWKTRLQSALKQRQIPELPKIWKGQALTLLQSAQETLDRARALQQELAKEHASDAAIQQAQTAVDQANSSVQACHAAAQEVAQSILKQEGIASFLSPQTIEDTPLMVAYAIQQASPTKLAEWCQHASEQDQEALVNLLNPDPSETSEDDNFCLSLSDLIQHGIPAQGNYGRTLQLYKLISQEQQKQAIVATTYPVLQRLALAVALELAAPLPKTAIHPENATMDPLQRYQHYQQAYLEGELDPAFDTFSVWQLRHVVNNDADHDELAWGRACLRNHRPDLVLSNDPHWRYTRIVRTDVAYKHPDWYKERRSYDQILSGGGECGPRAWYGRFITQAFGIPIWGCQQPGHAAMCRWTSKGWQVCLGADFPYCYWLGRCGPDFLLETQARTACSEDAVIYRQQVLRLEMVEYDLAPGHNLVRSKGIVDPNYPWTALAYFQRTLLAESPQTDISLGVTSSPQLHHNTIDRLRKVSCLPPLLKHYSTVGAWPNRVTIAADTTVGDKKNIAIMPSFQGCNQVWMGAQSELVYTLNARSLATHTKYQLAIQYNTIHRDEPDIVVSLQGKDTVSLTKISLDYTMGLWKDSDPVVIEVDDLLDDGTTPQLTLTRSSPKFGVAIYCIQLIPMTEDFSTGQSTTSALGADGWDML